MAVTFTQVDVKLQFDISVLADVVKEVTNLIGDNPNNIFTVDTSFHVGSIERADTVIAGLNTLRELGAIDQYRYENAYNQIAGFKRLYLK